MSNRCLDCNKFVSLEAQEPELNTNPVDGTSVSGNVRLVLCCAECGSELKEFTSDFDIDIDHICFDEDNEDDNFEIVNESADLIDEFETTDKKGKKVPYRYQKHFYGANINITVKCIHCGEDIEISEYIKEQASFFEDLY